MQKDDSLERKYRLSSAPTYILISFVFTYLAAISTGNFCKTVYGILGVLSAVWAILVCLSVLRAKRLKEVKRLVVKATEGVWEFYTWLFTVIAYFVGGVLFMLAELAGKDLPAGYFVIFWLAAVVVGGFLATQAWYIRR